LGHKYFDLDIISKYMVSLANHAYLVHLFHSAGWTGSEINITLMSKVVEEPYFYYLRQQINWPKSNRVELTDKKFTYG